MILDLREVIDVHELFPSTPAEPHSAPVFPLKLEQVDRVEQNGQLPGLLMPKSSERLVRHARARIPNDVRAREGDYFVGSRAPQTQGR